LNGCRRLTGAASASASGFRLELRTPFIDERTIATDIRDAIAQYSQWLTIHDAQVRCVAKCVGVGVPVWCD
jgi:hypothetical protein